MSLAEGVGGAGGGGAGTDGTRATSGAAAGPKPGLSGALQRLASRGARAAIRAASRRAASRPRSLSVAGLAGLVRVRFDPDGVPHVRAETEADAFRALGACHALDRFFQMDTMRRLFSGRLAALVGERRLGPRALPPLSKGTTTDVDRLMRALSLVPAARRVLAAASEEERLLLDAYVDGVNAALSQVVLRALPPEYRLLAVKPEPWTALDSCLLSKGMALSLSFKWRSGIVLAAVAEVLKDRPEHLAAILPQPPGPDTPTIARIAPRVRGLAEALSFVGWEAPLAGSNAWVVGGARSASGAPLLANDPHLDLSLPSVWYMASVSGGRTAAVGATLPGTPGVVVGRTPSVAWGLTNAMLDDGDLWAEEVDGTGTRYRVDGRWREMEVETHEVLRRGASPVVFRVRRTHRGPIVSDALPGYAGAPLSLRLTLFETTRDMVAFLRLGRARTAADVEAAAEGYGSPAQNVVWATTEGRCGYFLMGAAPDRPPGPHPILPRDGTTTASDWTGFVPAGRLPHMRIPPEGALVTANDPHAGPDYPHYLSCLYEPTYRARRIRSLLEGRAGFRPEDMAAIQMDAVSLGTEAFRRVVLLPVAEELRATRPAAAHLLDRCLLAIGPEGPEDVGPAYLHLVHHHLARRVFGPLLTEDLALRWMGCVNLVEDRLIDAFRDASSPWAKPPTRAALVADALEAAAKDMAARGLAPDAPWGAVHRLTLRHALSEAPIVGETFTRGPFPMGGGPYTPLSGQYAHHRPASMTVGASYRQVIDLADPEGSSRMIIYGGQSGHVGSPHYDDLTERWRRGGFVPMRLASWPSRGRDLLLHPS